MSSILYLVGANIKRLRKDIGFSQEELADACGLHRTYVGAVERGERNITIQSLEKIADELGVEVYSLVQKTDSDI